MSTRTLYQTIIHAALAVCLFILFQNGCNQPAPPSIKRIETLKFIVQKVKDSSAANLKIVYRDRVKTSVIQTYLKGDSWPYYVTDSAFCDSSIRHLLGAVEHLEKQHEKDSGVIVALEGLSKAQDSVIAEKPKPKKPRPVKYALIGAAAWEGFKQTIKLIFK